AGHHVDEDDGRGGYHECRDERVLNPSEPTIQSLEHPALRGTMRESPGTQPPSSGAARRRRCSGKPASGPAEFLDLLVRLFEEFGADLLAKLVMHRPGRLLERTAILVGQLAQIGLA